MTSLLAVLMVSPIYAQSKWAPTAIRLGTDISNWGFTLFDSNRTIYEFHADADFDKYFLVADYGIAERTRMSDNFTYNYAGSYFRIGPDVNLMKPDNFETVIFLGFRFARSSFNNDISFPNPGAFGAGQIIQTNNNLTATWLELVTGIKVKVWKNLFMGYTGRLKFSKSITATENLVPFEIPGLGRAAENSNWGFNYHIFYQIRFREKLKPAN